MRRVYMDKMISFCGLDCSQCEAYKATQVNDEAAKKIVAEKWQREFNIPPSIHLSSPVMDALILISG